MTYSTELTQERADNLQTRIEDLAAGGANLQLITTIFRAETIRPEHQTMPALTALREWLTNRGRKDIWETLQTNSLRSGR